VRKRFLLLFLSLAIIQLVVYSIIAFDLPSGPPRRFDIVFALLIPGWVVYIFAPFNPAEMSIGHPFLGILFSLPPTFLNSLLYAGIVTMTMQLVSRLRKRVDS
jgi:hypothetical protein